MVRTVRGRGVTPELAAQSPEALAAVRTRLAETGRAQLHDFLTPTSAKALLAEAQGVDFNIVTRKSTGHVDLPAAWLRSLDPSQKQALGQAVQSAATEEFQYLFDNHPIYDLAKAGEAAPVWASVVDFVNGDAFLDLMRRATGQAEITHADAQLTRFRPGHFLTAHDDTAEGKNRFFAYVLGLTPRWRIDWGGLLAFHDADDNVAEAFTPRFNTLNLLTVPQAHSVTQVALSAGADRISITGWLRGVE